MKKDKSVLHSLTVLIAFVCISFALCEPAQSQVVITQVAFNSGLALDVSAYPKIRARIRVMNGATAVVLNTSKTFLIEDNLSFSPTAVIAESQGVHVVEWITSQFERVGEPNQPSVLSFASTLLVSDGGSTATTSFATTLPMSNGARVLVRDSTSRNVPYFYDFGTVAVGSSQLVKLKVVASQAAKIGWPQNERPVLLESVSTRTSQFKVIWKGSFGSAPPPINIISPLEYRIDVVFTPTSSEPATDVLTVTFEGGMRTDVILSANPQVYPRISILNVVSPNGKEAFAPCQEIPIIWKGAVPGFKAFVEYTLDNGKKWMLIDSTLDSTIVWYVPQSYSDSARIRVYQKFQSADIVWLAGERASATSSRFSADGKYVLVAYSNNVVIEFDVATYAKVNTYSLTAPAGTRIRAVSYIGTTRNFVAACTKDFGGGELQVFTQGAGSAAAQTPIPLDFQVSDIGTNQNSTVLYAMPKYSGRILRFNPVTLAPDSPIILTSPAETSSINNNILNIVQFDGFIVRYDAQTGQEVSRVQTGLSDIHGPVAKATASSVNGNLTALGGQASVSTSGPREQRTFIYDMITRQAVKILYRESTDPVDLTFSPNNAFLGLGYRYTPQFLVYDLLAGKTLPASGSPEGHKGELTSLMFSPVGTSIVSTSMDSTNNTLLRKVNTPESDVSDDMFRIAPVVFSSELHTISPLLIGTSLNVNPPDICNTSAVPAIVEGVKLRSGTWLKMNTPFQKDTLMPGECLQLNFTAMPNDTGYLFDTLIISTCGAKHEVPFTIYSIDRDLTLLFDLEDFGDVCIGDKTTRRLSIIRNNDSVPVKINAVFMLEGLFSQFRIATPVSDAVIPPNETLSVDIEFAPRKLGYDTSVVAIRYADQSSLDRRVSVMGRGAGAEISFSHKALAFVPEIPERFLVIRNNSDNLISIDSAFITLGEPFTFVSNLPIVIPKNDSATVTVRYEGGMVGNGAKVSFAMAPCVEQSVASGKYSVRLTLYSGTASLDLPNVVSAPTNDSVSIPILAQLTENVRYDGMRFLEGTLRVNPRLFLAREIVSNIGTGEVLSQNIVNKVREVRFRIDGNFVSGEIGRLVGYAGMAEVDSTLLTFDTSAIAFGSSVSVSYRDGMLVIIHNDPVRRIIDQSVAPIIERIAPQPAGETADVEIGSDADASAQLAVVDRNGRDVIPAVTISLRAGNENIRSSNTFSLDVSDLPTGMYLVLVKTGQMVASSPMIVIH
ncbi:MAG: WD40 repeat domain-containing protein [Ignavibacteria bacterium]|nr:WD40 repeat domain-containing protein [Ignavibacteria bacterium]